MCPESCPHLRRIEVDAATDMFGQDCWHEEMIAPAGFRATPSSLGPFPELSAPREDRE
jgi:hypothetical protein